MKCEWCKGTGLNKSAYSPYDKVPCPDCEGTGEMIDEVDEDDDEETSLIPEGWVNWLSV